MQIAKKGKDMKRIRQNGFTLVELMIIVAVIGILASIAYPSYTQYVARGYRASAQSEMMVIANQQQQFFLANRSYASSLSGLGYTLPSEVDARYDATMTVNNAATPPSFSVTLAPTGNQASDGTLVLTSAGVKTRDGDASKW
jgi:type IV pilus assembly protein PilE